MWLNEIRSAEMRQSELSGVANVNDLGSQFTHIPACRQTARAHYPSAAYMPAYTAATLRRG